MHQRLPLPAPSIEDEVDGVPAEDRLAKQIENLIATHERLRFCKDGTPIFRVEKEKSATEAEDVLILSDAPEVKHWWKFPRPKLSRWSAHGWDDNKELLETKHEAEVEDKLKGLQDGQTFAQNFGHWSANGGCVLDKDWFDVTEPEEIGQTPQDTFQEEMAELLAKKRRFLVLGRGGDGKSHLIKLLRPKLEALGYKVMCIAFTHVAVTSLNGAECPAYTILHMLHQVCGQQTQTEEICDHRR